MGEETLSLIQRLKAADTVLFLAADTLDLTDLTRRSRDALGFDPPPDYMDFLRATDGAVAEGVMLYGAHGHALDDIELPGVIEMNLERRAYREDLAETILLGEIDDDFIAFDGRKGGYCRIDRVSGDRHHPAESLGRLVGDLLAPAG